MGGEGRYPVFLNTVGGGKRMKRSPSPPPRRNFRTVARPSILSVFFCCVCVRIYGGCIAIASGPPPSQRAPSIDADAPALVCVLSCCPVKTRQLLYFTSKSIVGMLEALVAIFFRKARALVSLCEDRSTHSITFLYYTSAYRYRTLESYAPSFSSFPLPPRPSER